MWIRNNRAHQEKEMNCFLTNTTTSSYNDGAAVGAGAGVGAGVGAGAGAGVGAAAGAGAGAGAGAAGVGAGAGAAAVTGAFVFMGLEAAFGNDFLSSLLIISRIPQTTSNKPTIIRMIPSKVNRFILLSIQKEVGASHLASPIPALTQLRSLVPL